MYPFMSNFPLFYNLSDLMLGSETGTFNIYAIERARKLNQRAKAQKRRR